MTKQWGAVLDRVIERSMRVDQLVLLLTVAFSFLLLDSSTVGSMPTTWELETAPRANPYGPLPRRRMEKPSDAGFPTPMAKSIDERRSPRMMPLATTNAEHGDHHRHLSSE